MSVHNTEPDGSGRWFVRFVKGKLPDEPNATRKYFGRGKDAEQAAHVFNDHLGLGRKPAGITFGPVAVEFYSSKLGRIRDNSADTIRVILDRNLLPFFKDVPLQSIDTSLVDKYVSARLSMPSQRQPWKKISRSTVRRELGVLQSVLNWAVKRGYAAANMAAGYERPSEDDAVIPPATAEEIAAIMLHAPSHLKRFLLLSYYTAARPGPVEMLSIKWHDVDFKRGIIFIRSARKGGLVSRMIPIHDGLLPLLRQWKKDDGDAEYVIHYFGKRIGNINGAWRTAKSKAGIKRRLRLYDLRHAAITAMLEAGGDLKAVSVIAGHSSPAMTMRRYQHCSPSLIKQAIGGMVTLPVTGSAKITGK